MDFFYILSKIFWFVASPDHFILLLFTLATLLIYASSKWGIRLLSVAVVISMTIMFLPVADIILRPLEERFPAPVSPPDNITGVIVLGGAESGDLSLVWNMAQFNQASERMMAIPALARVYPNAQIVFSGGSGSLLHPNGVANEAMANWFKEHGVGERVMWEKQSRNTYENATLSEAMLQGVPKGRWLLVTSAFHMPRSMGIFRLRGWDVVAYPVDYYSNTADALRVDPKYWQHIRDLNFTLKEWLGLMVYYYTGKTDALFPAPIPVNETFQ